jgi:uncharacterized protein (TIGR02444 family)
MSESAFWNFSVGFYSCPGVAAACLQLQDRAGVDVNIALYMLFLATQHRRVDSPTLRRIDVVVASWQSSVITPLRSVRRHLKAPIGPFATAVTAPLRAEVQRIELAAERLQQEILEQQVPAAAMPADTGTCVALARDNLAAYAGHLGVRLEAPQDVIVAAFAQFIDVCKEC